MKKLLRLCEGITQMASGLIKHVACVADGTHEPHEAVNHSGVGQILHSDASIAQRIGIGLAFVVQGIESSGVMTVAGGSLDNTPRMGEARGLAASSGVTK